jgi:hypothetical protein
VASETVDPQQFYKAEHGDDWRPALQAAFTTGAERKAEVILPRSTYFCRQKDQTGAVPNIHVEAGYGKALFYVENSIRMRSVNAEGTRIIRRNPQGGPMGVNDYFDASGYKWRGGIFLIRSTSTTSGIDPSLFSFTAHDILFDGGLRRSMELPFEIGDKGLWQANDRNNGNITLSGRAGFIGAASEQLYTSAIGNSEASRRVLTIGADCRFGETGGSAINTNGITTWIERCLLENSFIGVEGWTGADGGYLKARIVDCARSTIQAGTFATGRDYFAYTSPMPGITALGMLDVVLERSSMDIGSGLRGIIAATDCCPAIGNGAAFNSGVSNTQLEVVSISSGDNLSPGLFVLGGAEGSQATSNVKVKLALRRTGGTFRHVHGLGYYGSFGSGVEIKIIEKYPEIGTLHLAFAAVYDTMPDVTVG